MSRAELRDATGASLNSCHAERSRGICFFLCLLCFLCLPSFVFATTVSGTIQKPDGTPLTGTIEFTLSQQAKTTTPPITYAPVKTTCAVTAGAIAAGCTVQGNDTLDPAGTYYRVRVLDANNVVVLPSTNYTFSGAAVDLSSLPVTTSDTLVPPTGSVTGNLNVTGNLTVGGSATFGADPQDFAHLRLLGQTADPATQAAGSAFHRSDLNRIRFRVGGLEVFDGTQYLPISTPAAQTFEFGGHIRIPDNFAATFKRMNQIRLVDPNLWTESGVPAKIDAAIADLAGQPGLILLPSNLGAGNPTSVPTTVSLLDLRTAAQARLGEPDPPVTGLLSVHWPDSSMAAPTSQAALAVSAVAGTTSRAVNGLWAFCQDALDSCFGMTQQGAQAQGFLMDVQPNTTTGAAINGIRLGSFDTATGYHYWTPMVRLNNAAAALAPEYQSTSLGGKNFMRGGTVWLLHPDSSGRTAVVAAPTGPTATVITGTGTLPAGHYRFKISALNDVGEGLPSAATSDLVINANEVIRVTWNKVAGARAYRVYAAYNASADPGTANADYFLQNVQTSATANLKRLLVEDDLGDGVGTATFELWNEFRNSGFEDTLINNNPLDEDRSAFYYLRAGNLSSNFLKPSADKLNLDKDGRWVFRPANLAGDPFHIAYPATTSLTSLFRLSDAGTDYVNWAPTNGGVFNFGTGAAVAQLVLKKTGTGQDLTLQGGTSSLNPKLSAASGSVTLQGFNVSFSSIDGTSTSANKWTSAVTDANAAANGAFALQSTVDIGAANDLFRLGDSASSTLFAVKGDGSVTVNGGITNDGGGFKHARVSTGSIAASSSAAVTLTWTTAFADANYTANCSVVEAAASTSTLRIHHLESIAAASVTVRVVNDDGAAAHTGTLHCLAVHD